MSEKQNTRLQDAEHHRDRKLIKNLSGSKILWPVLIGLGVAGYLFYRGFDARALAQVQWDFRSFLWIAGAVLMTGLRQYGYMWRIRTLTDRELSWGRSSTIILLWEFASAITPSIIGGTAVAFWLLMKEKIRPGRTTAIVLITALLDELFFILLAPLFILLIGVDNIFPLLTGEETAGITGSYSLLALFLFGYLMLLVYTLLLLWGIFYNPRGLSWLLIKICSIRWLRKWREGARRTGEEIIITSRELKSKPRSFWAESFGATLLSWSARYLSLNFLIQAFAPTGLGEQITIFGRQFVMWIIMLIPVTPGGSGVAEIIFPAFIKDFVPVGLLATLALLWRTVSYYPYLILGLIVLPRWIRRVFPGRSMR